MPDAAIGRMSGLVLSRTADSATAVRASARAASDPTSATLPAAGIGFSNRPISNFTRRIRLTASSILACLIVPACDQCLHRRDEADVVGRDHDHVDAGVDRLLDGRRVVARHDLVDAAPVRHDEPGEGQLALEDVGDQVVVAVDLARGGARVGGHDDPGASSRWRPGKAAGRARAASPRPSRRRPGRAGRARSGRSPPRCRRPCRRRR